MAAVIAPQHPQIWHHQPEHTLHIRDMDMTGLPIYDASHNMMTGQSTSRGYPTASSHINMQMPLFSAHGLTTTMPYQPGAFAFDTLPANPYNMQQAFPISYTPEISPTVSYGGSSDIQRLPTVPEARNGFAMGSTPPVKCESSSPVQSSPIFRSTSYSGSIKQEGNEAGCGGNVAYFSTHVDTLMKAIQAKQQSVPKTDPVEDPKPEDISPPQRSKKRYYCRELGCDKTFTQKTHLDIHARAHTGDKPFLCDIPHCGKRFSQMGNLKTHRRRHTGERPYTCELCGKTFAQAGNVKAHMNTHKHTKPFECRLEENGQRCGKEFTQLGNLKSHQNKFHAHTIRYLTQKFASINAGDSISEHDKNLWEYFSELYKNSNKGIKGRGKDRKISSVSSSTTSSSASYTTVGAPSTTHNYVASFQHSGSDRSSRSSSMTSEAATRVGQTYDFNAPMQPQGYASHDYNDMVFPERKLYTS
ncbi:zinc finger protein OZF [Byssothecium circinans]|uniref:Zinc finger protein OZF n=1 Tax=Byssothecium circinans TaxID=147558 RepID=A0A6A5TY17_9PLEO|nr:zinc finger protein OZF [Byssothecium circinans]